ncbi:MAG: 50S ribosomal protein L21 [Phycisphaerae bacterium]|nr:50S ribosomal protein L21 [Phycisphaerae bacterium]
MYAIFEDGSRQYRVYEHDVIDVDVRDLPEGTQQVEFSHVLLIGDEKKQGSTRVGQPWLSGVKVVAKVQNEVKDEKVTITKYSRRKGYRRNTGHRQRFMRVQIEKILC